MDLFDTRYFSINKALLKFAGLWAGQERSKNLFLQTILVSYLFLNTIPHYCAAYKQIGVLYKTLFHLTAILYFYSVLSKYVVTIGAQKKITAVFQVIADNWAELKDENEQIILLEYFDRGRKLTVFYITYLFSALIFFVSGPLLPFALDIVHPLENGTRPMLYIMYGDYGIDPVKNYSKIFIFECTACVVSVIVTSTVDTMYVVCVEHCLALFSIAKYRLQASTKTITHDLKYASYYEENVAHNLVINIIKLHKKIIHELLCTRLNLLSLFVTLLTKIEYDTNFSFVDQLESTYSKSFLFIILVNGVHVTLMSVLIIKCPDDMTEKSRYVSILVGIVIHLFYLSWPGQKMISSSSDLFKDVYMNEWYKCSIRTQNLLKFMTQRCIVPCYLTAGGIYVMNFENFAAIVKTAVSYIAVFSSFT